MPAVSEKDKSVLTLKKQRDKLKRYRQKCDANAARQQEIARSLYKQGRKDAAMLALKKRKYQEGLLAKTDQMVLNLEEMISQVEFAEIQVKVMEGLAEGNEVLKQIHEAMPIEDVEQILEDTEEAKAIADEIAEALNGQLDASDLEECEAELLAIEQEQADVERLAQAKEAQAIAGQMLDAPTTDVPQAEPEPAAAAEAEAEPEAEERVMVAA